MKLKSGDSVIVTGASSGIGAAVARRFATEAVNLLLTGRDTGQLESVVAAARLKNTQVDYVVGDLAVAGTTDRILAKAPNPAIIVSSAGAGLRGSAKDLDVDRQCQLVRLNCEALAHLTLAALPKMVTSQRGVIVHIASIAGLAPIPMSAVYGATKSFVLSFSQALDLELKDTGVRVVAICPGPVPTDFQRRAGAMSAMKRPPWERREPSQVAEDVMQAIAQPRAVVIPNMMDRMQYRNPRFVGLLRDAMRRVMWRG